MSDLREFQHPRFARMYERISAESERRGTAGHRDRALAGLAGRVIEIGAGNGMNFAHYPKTVTEVVAIEPERQLRTLAERAAADAPIDVTVAAAHADDLRPPARRGRPGGWSGGSPAAHRRCGGATPGCGAQ